MPGIKITELGAISDLTASDLMECVDVSDATNKKATLQDVADFVGANLTALSVTPGGWDDPAVFIGTAEGAVDPAVLILDNSDSELPLFKARVDGETLLQVAHVGGWANLLIGSTTALTNWGGFSDSTAALMIARDLAADGADSVQFEIVHFQDGISGGQSDIALRCGGGNPAVSIDIHYTPDQIAWHNLALKNGPDGPGVYMTDAVSPYAERKVLGRRVIDADLSNSAAASYDANTRTLINALRSVILTHGLGASS